MWTGDRTHRRARCKRIVWPGLLAALLLAACTPATDTGYVQMEKGRLLLRGEPFFPVAINYIADLQWNGDSCWASSSFDYQTGGQFRFRTRTEARALMLAEFKLIRELGFNTVRIVGMTSNLLINPDSGTLVHPSRYDLGQDTVYTFEGNRLPRYLDAVADMVDVAAEAGLHAIILLRLNPDEPLFEEHALQLVGRLKDRPAVLAYDLFNEPLYFDKPHHRDKKDVHGTVKRWRRSIRKAAPDQLVTIGLVGVPEVFSWDPNILDVDFISFHPYEYEPEQVRNEIYWYGRHVAKPWMIGETAIPADNDSVPYAEQLAFARKTLARTVACGGIGYSWWQFKDVKWGRYHADHMGVLDRTGWTEVDPGLPPIDGTVKPVAKAFQEFDPTAPTGTCEVLPNYHNYSSFSGARLYGRLVDKDRNPVPGGVVNGWNEDWSIPWHTIAKDDGTFELYADFRYHHWMASATRYSMVRGDCQPGAYLTGPDGTASYYLGDLVLEKLDLDETGRSR